MRIRFSLIAVSALALVQPTSGQRPPSQDQPESPKVEVRVDPRIELFSVIFRLGGHPEYNQGLVDRYTDAVEKHFRPHADHPVVAMARELRRTRGISYDAVPSLAVHVTDPPELAERVPLTPLPETLEVRWTTDHAKRFLALARDFAHETRFADFFERQKRLWGGVTIRVERALHDKAHLEWFDAFFGVPFDGTFVVSLGMLTGPQCYGARVHPDGGTSELHCILGVWATNEQGLPRFDDEMIATVIHEFVHSYTNPIVDAHAKSLRQPGETMFPWVEKAMTEQAYGTWRIMMYESIVRACVIRYLTSTGRSTVAVTELEREKKRQFLWIEPLDAKLAEYERKRNEYATFEDFFPQIVAFFTEYAPKFAAERAAQSKRVPKIVKMTPANGATDVDPMTDKITIVFDRDMDTLSWSVVGQGPHVPKLEAQVHYIDKRTFVIPVKLLPEWDYRFSLNSSRYRSFSSAEGVPLEPVPISFHTRADK